MTLSTGPNSSSHHARHLRTRAIDDGRQKVKALGNAVRSLATRDDASARCDARAQHLLDVFELTTRGERSHLGGHILRIADADRLRLRDEPLEQRIVNTALHDAAANRPRSFARSPRKCRR